MKKEPVQDTYVKMQVRLPKAVHSALQFSAELNGRSMNAEIIARVAEAEDRISLSTIVKQNEDLKRMMREMLDAIELRK